MSQSESPATLLVPEILTSIAQSLSRKDFLNAVLVCRSWHATLIPLLWHTLALPQRWRVIMADTDAPSGFPDPAVFRKYAHLVRSLACNNIQYHLHYLAPYCSQLTELDVIDLTVDTLPLLRLNNETLTSVKFKREHELVKRSFRVLEFLQALSQCPSLDQLRLVDFKIEESSEVPCAKQQQQQWTYFDRHDRRRAAPSTISSTKTKAEEDKDAMAVSLLYEIVRRLSKLDLVRDVIMVPPKPTEVFYKLRRLALLDSTMSYRDQLQLVSQCQYLTHLKLQLTRVFERLDPKELAAVELEFACPHITHLDLSWSTLQDQEIAWLLRGTPHLTSFKAQMTNLGEITIDTLSGPSSRMRDQLWELDLVDAREMQSAWIQRILCSCSGLRQFRATEMNAQDVIRPFQGTDSTSSVSSSSAANSRPSSSIPTSGWVCLQLREFQVSIIMNNSLQDQLLVYDQLSQLTQLQILSLGGNSLSTWFRLETLDLSLSSGFDRLRTLQELREFNFSYMAHNLGMNEVEFMMEHWKKLRKVIGTIGVGVYDGGGGYNGNGRRVSGAKPKVERQEIYIHRKWPLVQFSST
ncbi:hypothetical protein BGZ58_008417 [Dissophora ornata]|nr:hypothetical protein BGZ58_008417 [Dissophora ornata]